MPGVLTYQEMLRTIGALMDHSGVETAVLNVSSDGVHIIARGWPWPRTWDVDALLAQVATQRSLRLHPRDHTIPRAGPVSKSLRVVGTALDIDDHGPYRVNIESDMIRVEGRDGYQRTFESRPLASRVRLAPHLRGQLSTASEPGAPEPSAAPGDAPVPDA